MNLSCDVLVIGAGASGVCAAIEAARQGARVILTEEHNWPGGMMTAAGVSCIDGNHNFPSGLYGELREKLYDHYGGAENLATGWVSHTCFEPSVGRRILLEMIEAEQNLQFLQPLQFRDVLKNGQQVSGANFQSEKGELTIEAEITIDGTELGDVLASAGCAYRLGRDARSDFEEEPAPEKADALIQDLTYVAILKDYGEGTDNTIAKPAGYDPTLFAGCCAEYPGDKSGLPSSEKMLSYGRLPNNKMMLNWPNAGNDYFANIAEADERERQAAFDQAKRNTLQFIYFIQTELGFKNWGLADDEFPTQDKLPLMPYHREGRRVEGEVTITLNDLTDTFADPLRPWYRQAVAVGNYPLDHHHSRGPLKEKEELPRIEAFSIPYKALVPQKTDGLIVAEKAISVSHLANGATRLQPVVMGIGQAAGAAAALCVKHNIAPRMLDIRELQNTLLEAGCWLRPFTDIKANDWFFYAVQRVALCGLMRGRPHSENWANGFLFEPDKEMAFEELQMVFARLATHGVTATFNLVKKESPLSRLDALTLLLKAQTQTRQAQNLKKKQLLEIDEGDNSQMAKPISRAEFAFLLDSTLEPFFKIGAEI